MQRLSYAFLDYGYLSLIHAKARESLGQCNSSKVEGPFNRHLSREHIPSLALHDYR